MPTSSTLRCSAQSILTISPAVFSNELSPTDSGFPDESFGRPRMTGILLATNFSNISSATKSSVVVRIMLVEPCVWVCLGRQYPEYWFLSSAASTCPIDSFSRFGIGSVRGSSATVLFFTIGCGLVFVGRFAFGAVHYRHSIGIRTVRDFDRVSWTL